jgi:hypothetical protein
VCGINHNRRGNKTFSRTVAVNMQSAVGIRGLFNFLYFVAFAILSLNESNVNFNLRYIEKRRLWSKTQTENIFG